ncbi:MAG: rod shape-determining protein MreC [Candidatus Promineifilaceae bacterium]|nr:rod shape-determining protein MreC [Candidatus Promineifilaceae bacterium]
MNETQDRIRWVTFAILVGVILLLLVLDSTGNLDNALAFVEAPVAALMEWTDRGTDRVTESLGGPEDLTTARLQIEQLQAQVTALQRENEQLREIQGEYDRLVDLFERASESPEFTRLTATVIAYDTSPIFRSIIIDKGSDDGVFVGMPVESARGLVGQIYRTTNRAAMVILVTDNISSVPGRLSRSRATGVVRGGGLGGGMHMDWIDLEAQVEVGEVVMTSGLGGRFPQDLVIGRVLEVERQQAELFQTAVIQPAVDFADLETVFIITDFRPIDTTIFDVVPEDVPNSP